MSLVRCSECGNQISTLAASCPKCGAPAGTRGIGTPLSTIQQTSKRLKLHIVLASVVFWIGTVWLFMAPPSSIPMLVAVFTTIAGGVWYLVTRLRVWWHHK